MIKKADGLATSSVLPGTSSTTSGRPELDAKFREVAQMYEKQFLQEMLKAMRSTVSESGLVKINQGERIFREQLDQQYVDKWGDKGGIGLADLIYDQLVFHYGPKMPVAKPEGPLHLNDKSNFTLQRDSAGTGPARTPTSSSKASQSQTFEFVRKSPDAKAAEPVLAPWSGLLQKRLDLGPDETFLEMWHDNGLKSRFVLKGATEALVPGQKLQEGESLGSLSPETKNFFWNVSM
jgi:flagellar protein FlgJ